MEQNERKGQKTSLKQGELEVVPRLMRDITRLGRARMRSCDHSVMARESTRLIIISLSHGEGVTQLDLVKKTHLRPPTVSVELKRLEEDGYIRREQDPDDMRAMRVYFTEKGRQLDREFFAHALETDAIIMKDITAEESATLEKLLTRMRENILNELNPKGEEIIK